MTIPEATSHLTPDLLQSPTADPAAWAIVKDYASGIIDTFPEAEEKLIEYLGINYHFSDWQGAFRAIDNAEEDTADQLHQGTLSQSTKSCPIQLLIHLSHISYPMATSTPT